MIVYNIKLFKIYNLINILIYNFNYAIRHLNFLRLEKINR